MNVQKNTPMKTQPVKKIFVLNSDNSFVKKGNTYIIDSFETYKGGNCMVIVIIPIYGHYTWFCERTDFKLL